MNAEDIGKLLPVEHRVFCSFCRFRESSGTVTLKLGPDMPVTLYICNICVDQAKAEGFSVEESEV